MALDEVLARLLLKRLDMQEHVIAELRARIETIEARNTLEYRGVWESGRTYGRGNCVTHSGALWVAQSETSARPGDGETPWRLAVKRGNGAPPEPPPGRVPTMPRSRSNGR